MCFMNCHRFHQYCGHKHVTHLGRMAWLPEGHHTFLTTIVLMFFTGKGSWKDKCLFWAVLQPLPWLIILEGSHLKKVMLCFHVVSLVSICLQGFTTWSVFHVPRSLMSQEKAYHENVLWWRLWKCIWRQEYFCQETQSDMFSAWVCPNLQYQYAHTESLVDVDRR